MPLRRGLLDDIRQALGDVVGSSLTMQSHVSDIYEAYVFSVLLQAARTEGARVMLSSIQGGASTFFVFRTSPGYLNSRRHNYGYAELHFPGCPPLEVHISVRVAGHSNVLHECDVSVIDQAEAHLCRGTAQTLAPRSARVRIAIEAKFYTTSLALQLGRGFLGLVRDLSSDNAFFVFNREAKSVQRLLAHKKQQWENNVVPANDVPVTRLRNAFQGAFKNYRARAGV